MAAKTLHLKRMSKMPCMCKTVEMKPVKSLWLVLSPSENDRMWKWYTTSYPNWARYPSNHAEEWLKMRFQRDVAW